MHERSINDANASNITIRNNSVSGNNEWQIYLKEGVVCDHNLINGFRGEREEETKETNYREGDPSFIDRASSVSTEEPFILKVSVYTLRSDSIAVDSGSSLEAPSIDVLGNIRPQGEVDVGSHEYTEAIWNSVLWRDYESQIGDWTALPGLDPEPEPEQEAEAREESGDILGFPAASLVFGLSATALALLRKRT